ncbi:MAG: TlpA family protein disulfide reductase [Gammaproteobacteria bacterium]|nr:TlpA family protein disulfide reductase [Gammaproteobacteria bacterium]
MLKPVQVIAILIAAIASLTAGYYFAQTDSSQTKKSNQLTVTQRPDFSLYDLEDQLRHINEWNGQVVMVNFWATWCPPCRSEMPAFEKLYTDYKDKGFTIVGIAVDNKQSVIDFVDPLGIDYPILMGEEKGIQLAKDFGNHLGALPYTVIINRKGQVTHLLRKELNYQEAEALISPLI